MDYKGKKCIKCNKGIYVETSINDDWNGRLHCNKCNHEIQRHKKEKEQ